MGILGIGVDVVHLPRIVALLNRRGAGAFSRRILSPEELAGWQNLPTASGQHAQFLGVRWAVKEAAYKALYPAARPTWKDLTYRGLSDVGQKPMLVYHGHPGGRLGKIHCSISHDGEYIFASVLVETV